MTMRAKKLLAFLTCAVPISLNAQNASLSIEARTADSLLSAQNYERAFDAFDALTRRHHIAQTGCDLLFGPVRQQLSRHVAARKPALLVLGNLPRRGVERLLVGSTVEHMLVRAHCDILVVPRPALSRQKVQVERPPAASAALMHVNEHARELT